MLKVLAPEETIFSRFKCGEIYCLSKATYNVSCCFCETQISFDEFLNHFQQQHPDSRRNSIIEEDPIKEEIDIDIYKADILGNPKGSVEVEKEHFGLAETEIFNRDSSDSSHDDDEWKNENFENSGKFDDEDVTNAKENNEQAGRFACSYSKCDRSYKSKRGLWNHLRINHNPNRPKKLPKKTHQCQECGESFRTERHLRGHMWKHTGIKCDVCGKTFTQTGNMIRHKIRHTGVKAHKCKECDFSFYTEKELRSHMIRHTGVMPIICEICGRRCRDHGVLTAHMRRHTGERPAKCDVCGKSFFSFHDLNVHAVTHTTERPFACDVCGSTFQRKKALRVHKKVHSIERKHSCKICDKQFNQSSGLNAHMRRHNAAISKTSTNAEPHDVAVSQRVVTIELTSSDMISDNPPDASMALSIDPTSWNT